MNFKHFTQSLRITGYVRSVDKAKRSFTMEAFSGDSFEVVTTDQTWFHETRNSDKLDRDISDLSVGDPLDRYLEKDKLVSAYGIHISHGGVNSFTALDVMTFGEKAGVFSYEEGHWWLTQITSFADTWLERQFGLTDDYDFTSYRTNLTASGSKIEDLPIQECDTIARLVYGLSSAYHLTGNARYLAAARAGVEYQRKHFRTISHDGSFVIWHHAIKRGNKILGSLFSDDFGAIPLYEQIYAIAGLTQYFKITQDWETLNDILRSVEFFVRFYKDNSAKRGFYSHVHPVSLRYDEPRLGDNRSKKNWNSVGDHTPAYLLNLLLSLENVNDGDLRDQHEKLVKMQIEVADLIVEHFPDPDKAVPYVRERFHEDWSYDDKYKWQQDRAVVGHNLKIAWNLTRVYHMNGDKKYLDLAVNIASKMEPAGMDMVRGGWFDVVERRPKNGLPIQFTWHNRKAWWQQEQAILAYLILGGTVDDSGLKEKYVKLARESVAFWNLAFLDHDYGETYFDVTDNGIPYLKEDRAQVGSHSKSGYHSMELNYLAHIYHTLLLKEERELCLYFKLAEHRRFNTVNVMPDFLPRGRMEISRVSVNGESYSNVDHNKFQVILGEAHKDCEVAVTVWIRQKKGASPA